MYSRTVSQGVQGFLKGYQHLSALLQHESRSLSSHTHYAAHPDEKCSPGAVKSPAIKQVTWCQRRSLHFTPENFAAKAKNSKKKVRKPVNLNKKGTDIPTVLVHNNMTVAQLASVIGRGIDHVFEVLMLIPKSNKYDSEDSVLDDMKVIQQVVKKSGMKCQTVGQNKVAKEKEACDVERQPLPDPSVLVKRPPVVTIMGHVDHGKTTLLDHLRQSNIVDQEFGGITQHIGAFKVKLPSGESICFLDTPGHAAFSAMRARGAQVTDIVVLVVAADDGVMQQTIESIQHAQSAGVPVIVAINKIDKFDADVERAKRMLLEHQLVLEEFGGDIQAVPISALQGTNVDLLQEAIITQAELMELKGDPVGLVEGRIVEAEMDSKRGKLATAVIQRGTLRRGTYLVAGTAWAKVRGMFDDQGRPLQEAPPSTPVEILGWKEVPSAGDEMLQVESESVVKEVIEWRQQQAAEVKQEEAQKIIDERREEHKLLHREEMRVRHEAGFIRSNRKRMQKTKEIVETHEGPQFSLVLKGDVDGSVEAILDTLDLYNSKQCRLDLVHFGVGNVTESDVELAEAFDGEIFAFNVEAPPTISKMAASRKVPLRMHNVIYNLFNELRERMSSRLPVLVEEDAVGEAKVLQVFYVTEGRSKVCVAGCRCTKGMLSKKKNFKVLRHGEIIYQGELTSLKHFKSEVESVKMDRECGISVDNPNIQFQVGDVIVCYDTKEVEQEIDWTTGF
ncbi:translation initiation factor IF-2, mitochondrial-like [Littorina saxatilis]|uniref:translation initiation factor IF-2, mitochondrial-like n=1 Tax=Littorina saxatilis TaxID=31220 RepID=UPI0038B620C0